MALFRINMQTMELDSYSVSLATVVRALLLNDWKGKSAALPGHCPGGPVPAAAYDQYQQATATWYNRPLRQLIGERPAVVVKNLKN